MGLGGNDLMDIISHSEEDERRMDIIGQNGNDGLHYEDVNEVPIKEEHKEVKTETDLEEIDSTSEGKPINPTPKDLEKLANALNIEYSDEDVELDRLTDTTQTLINNVINMEEEKSKNTLRYEGRK